MAEKKRVRPEIEAQEEEEDDWGEFAPADAEDDDEETIAEAEEEDDEEGDVGGDELEALEQDKDLPIEELLKRYGKPGSGGAADDESDDEDMAGPCDDDDDDGSPKDGTPTPKKCKK